MSRSKKEDIRINALPITIPEDKQELDFTFFPDKKENRFVLSRHEYPERFMAAYPNAAKSHNELYTAGRREAETDKKEESYNIRIVPGKAPQFASGLYHHALNTAFEGVADYRRFNFIRRPELWFRDSRADEDGFEAYKRFFVTLRRTWFTEGWGLFIQYAGHSYRYPHAVAGSDDVTIDPDMLSRVLVNGYVMHYKGLPDHFLQQAGYRGIYPVVNLKIRKSIGQFPEPDPSKNKLKEYVEESKWFRDEILLKQGILENIGWKLKQKDWQAIPKNSQYSVSHRSNILQFGSGSESVNPYTGLNKSGPYRPPAPAAYRFLFILSSRDIDGAGRDFYQHLAGKVPGVSGLNHYATIPGKLRGDWIEFNNEDDPLPEIIRGLDKLQRDPNSAYFAFYLSPITREEPDEGKHLVYYRVKEELLKRQMASQVIERDTIMNSNLNYSIPNIAAATVAKLGGVPWKLKAESKPGLIVGIGAFKPKGFSHRYLGSAFCFRSDGTFRGLRCFPDNEPDMLAASVREALYTYLEENSEAGRLVIHFYKSMSRRERKPILEMLKTLGLDIPVVVITVAKAEQEERVLFDVANPEMLPRSGLNVPVGKNDILLCNNTRYFLDSRVKRGFYFPVRLRFWCSEEELLYSQGVKQELVEQVYRFSRLYWKSVSQQQLPVTVKYPEMVARMFPHFKSLSLPDFGRKSLWFL